MLNLASARRILAAFCPPGRPDGGAVSSLWFDVRPGAPGPITGNVSWEPACSGLLLLAMLPDEVACLLCFLPDRRMFGASSISLNPKQRTRTTCTWQVQEPFTKVTGYRLTTDPTYLFLLFSTADLPSVRWHCWLGVRNSIQSVKIEWWGVGVIICLEWGADCLHTVQLTPCHPKTPSSLASFKSRLVLPFWYWLTQAVLEKRSLNGGSSVVVIGLEIK